MVSTDTGGDATVVLFNCNCCILEMVVDALVLALGCSTVTAIRYTEIAETFGSVVLFRGGYDECAHVAAVIAEWGMRVEVQGV